MNGKSADWNITKCVTEHPEDAKADEVLAASDRAAVEAITPNVTGGTINVYFHVINQGTGVSNGDVTSQMIADQIAVLNTAFGQWGYTFNLVFTDLTTNAIWFQTTQGSPAEISIKSALRRGTADDLNIYTVHPSDASLGWSTFPWDYAANPSLDGVMILYSTLPGGDASPHNLGDTLVHNVGHWLGLYDISFKGCNGRGDEVSDTPPERNPAYGCPIGRDTCKRGGHGEQDPVHNFMDSTDDACMDHFTAGQDARMDSLFTQYRFGK